VMPVGYVAAHLALAYASTVHAAQGVRGDTSRPVATAKAACGALRRVDPRPQRQHRPRGHHRDHRRPRPRRRRARRAPNPVAVLAACSTSPNLPTPASRSPSPPTPLTTPRSWGHRPSCSPTPRTLLQAHRLPGPMAGHPGTGPACSARDDGQVDRLRGLATVDGDDRRDHPAVLQRDPPPVHRPRRRTPPCPGLPARLVELAPTSPILRPHQRLQTSGGSPRTAITICECRCGAPGWECSRLGAGNGGVTR
jgi:hypothetical protein